MQTPRLLKVHKDILEAYKSSLLPIIWKYFGNESNTTEEKPGEKYTPTLVSQADLEINEFLLKKLPHILPESKIISEESETNSMGEYTFIIDPIDGTHSFVRNLDDWGIIIILCEKGEVIYSIIFFPNSKTEYYYAIKGLGAFDSEKKKISPRKFFAYKPAFVCAPSSRKIGRALIDHTENRSLSFRTYGSVATAFYTLLRGGSDFIVFDDLSIWDILGCTFISEQVGLVVYWFGLPPKLDGSTDLKKSLYTVMIYKPDFDIPLLNEIQTIIQRV